MEAPKLDDMNKMLRELLTLMVSSVSSREQLKKLIRTHEEIDRAWMEKEINSIR